jgi:hypothetical protein
MHFGGLSPESSFKSWLTYVLLAGMTGWIKMRNEETYYYKAKEEEEEWPPKFWKFILKTAEEPKCEAAFVDSRRFAR